MEDAAGIEDREQDMYRDLRAEATYDPQLGYFMHKLKLIMELEKKYRVKLRDWMIRS